MVVAHLRSSPFFGGVERLMLGLALSLPAGVRSVFLLFNERGKQRDFHAQLRQHGQESIELEQNWPRVRATVRELAGHLVASEADLLCCHGYKADLLGLWAARRAGRPVLAVAHGWTGHTPQVRAYEAADRLALRGMDRVVCVSEAQADKVRRAGVREDRLVVIPNAIQAERFDHVDPAGRQDLERLLPRTHDRIVGAAGRLSPEKGFGQLVAAAELVAREHPEVGFVIFGDGPLRAELGRQVTALGLEDRLVLAGHRSDLDRFLPHLDLLVLPSFTEGLPIILLEAFAAGVPVVATAVGGIPEVVEDGVNGYLVPPGDPIRLAQRIGESLRSDAARRALGQRGRARVRARFTFTAQATQYQRLFETLTRPVAALQATPSGSPPRVGPGSPR